MLTRKSRILVGQGREEIHPLVNSAILRNILGFLDVGSLKSVRATCTFWNEGAYSLLQSKSKVTIFWHNATGWEPTYPTFMKYVKSVTPENVFFRNYQLSHWRLHSKEVEMTQFWLQCGQHIQNLVLSDDFRFYEESCIRNVFFNWTPNMKSLNIDYLQFINDPNYKPILEKKVRSVDCAGDYGNCNEEDRKCVSETEAVLMEKLVILEDIQPNYKFRTFRVEQSHKYPVFPLQWKEVFTAYPNLETLSVAPVFHNDVDNIKELLTELISFQEANPDKLQNMKTLDIFSRPSHSAMTEEHFEEAMKLNFKLESLDIVFEETENLNYSTIAKYISKLSTALKSLTIGLYRVAMTVFPPPGNRIIFPSLISLRIEPNALSTNNVEFLQNIPGLEELFLGNCVFTGCDVIDPRLFLNTVTMKPMHTLHTLHIGDDILTEDCIRKIGEWFPNLSQFGAILDDNLLWATYKFLHKSVEMLIVRGKRITDVGITGIEATENGKEPKPSSSKSLTEDPPTMPRKRVDDVENQTNLGIAQMKKLRHLTISSVYIPNSESVELTDDAVYNGFIFLTELTYLKLSHCYESITEGAFRDLCSHRNIMTLATQNLDWESGRM